MKVKTHKTYHEKRKWYVYFEPVKGKCTKRWFAYKRDMTEFIQVLEDEGYTKAN